MINKKLYKHIFLFILTVLLLSIFSQSHTYASDPTNSWNSTTILPISLASQVLQTYNNQLILLGGANSVVFPENISSTLNKDGTINNWISSSFQFPAIFWHASIINNNHIYVLGGETYPPASSLNTVYTTTVDNTGINASWVQLNPLPDNLALGASIIVGGRIYYAGGFNNSNTIQKNIYYAQINSEGTIGSWSIAGTLPKALNGFGMIVNGDNIIIVGGSDANGQSQAAVYTSPLNSNGSIGSWTSTNSLPQGIYRSNVLKIGSKVISVGGENNGIELEEIYYADLNPDGTVGKWQTSLNFLPQPVCCSAAVATNDYIYLIGGSNSTNGYLNTVYYSKINKSSDLNVPSIKQTSQPWQSQEYDSAHLWNPQDPTINSWGCALTSAAMIFRYYGINELPDGKTLDPGTLNGWLKSQPDGYINTGWINWLALSRLSKISTSINNIISFDALEYNRITGSNIPQLTTDINNQQPDILEEPGHFIVAKGINDTTFDINDPYYNRLTLNDGYNNSFLSMGQYTPSHTDLSYIMATTSKEITVQLFNSQNTNVANSFIQQSIINPLNISSKSPSISLLYYSKPPVGTYHIKTSGLSTGPYKMTLYLYDKDGNVNIATESGIASPKNSNSYTISFDPQNENNDKVTKIVSFDSVIQDIKTANQLHLLNTILAVGLIGIVENSEGQYKKHPQIAIKLLQDGIKLLNLSKSNATIVSPDAYGILITDFTTLVDSL